MAIKIFPYKQGSRGAKALADALGGRVLKRVGSKYKVQREGDLVINWGASDCLFSGRGVANQPAAIEPASNKLKFFQLMKEADVSTPEWTTDKNTAELWVYDGITVMCRTKLQGHSGEGIVVAEKADDVVAAPLYTKYVKKQDEYRIHVLRRPGGDTSIISIQRKAKRRDLPRDEVDFKIRNLANGFVFVRDGVNPPECVLEEAKKALEATALAFGAVDVIYNAKQDKAYVLEINTAPGLEGQTVEDYANAFRNL